MPEKVNGNKPRFTWTEESEEKLKRLAEAGHSDLRIAGSIGGGCTEGQVNYARRCLAERGVVQVGRKIKQFTDDEDDFIRRTYCHDGWPLSEIAKALSCAKVSIKRRVDKLGLRRENDDARARYLTRIRSKAATEAAARERLKGFRSLWTARTESQRIKLYNGQRYEDAPVPPCAPRCGGWADLVHDDYRVV